MRNLARTVMLAGLLLAGATAFAQVSIGIQIGPPPPPRVVVVEPPRPGPEYVWVDGYWYPVGHHYKWHEGYWTRPPYEGYHWVRAHYDYDGDRYFAGYWEGDRGRFEHDHHWDRDRDRRDWNRHREHDRDDHDRDHDRDRDDDR